MQQLQNASDPVSCAGVVMDAMLDVLVSVREICARRHGGGTTLMWLRAMGVVRKRRGATLSTVSDQLGITLSATSRLIDGLVAKKYVKRTVPSGNRRTVSLELTAAGMKALQAAMKETHEELAVPLAKLSAKERESVCRAMEVLQSALRGSADGQGSMMDDESNLKLGALKSRGS